MSHLLSICHSVGDSNIIKETAKELAKYSIQTTILVVGAAARNNIIALLNPLEGNKENPLPEFISMLDLDELLPDIKPIENKLLELKDNQIKELSEKLNIQKFSALLVGTPSYIQENEQCEIPEQLLAKFGSELHSAVVSDYAFYDPKHHLATHKWFNMAKEFFVPFEKALFAFGLKSEKEETTKSIQTVVVGHPSVDAAKMLYQGWLSQNLNDEGQDQKRNAIREKLELRAQQKFIFVAGGKAADEAMIKALASTCQKFPDIQIILGMHPASTAEYFSSIQSIIDENNVQNQIKFIPKSVSTEEAVYAADGVLTVTSTVGTTAASCEKLVAFYQENESEDSATVPYIVDESDKAIFCTEQNQLLSFYQSVKDNSKPMTMKDVALGETAAEKIARGMRTLMNI